MFSYYKDYVLLDDIDDQHHSFLSFVSFTFDFFWKLCFPTVCYAKKKQKEAGGLNC